MTKSLQELWLKYAEDNLCSAKVLLDADIHNMVCFHAQQAVEKSFKAVIVACRQPAPRWHNLMRLRHLCEDLLGFPIPLDAEALRFLHDVHLDIRYPTDLTLLPDGLPRKEDAERAYQWTKTNNPYS